MFDFLNRNEFPLFFAGGVSNNIEEYIIEKDCLRLLSYANEKKLILKRCNRGLKTFMDSGAFSASTKGINIDIDEYIDFCNTHSENLHLYCQFDVIPVGDITGDESAKRTIENYNYMRPKMKEPNKLLYVFHCGEPFEYLEQMLNRTEDKLEYIAFGGLVRKRKKDRIAFMEKAFEVVKNSKNPNVKIHAFGMTSFDLLEQFPFTSADSTSWIHYARFGQVETSLGGIILSDRRTEEKNHFYKFDNDKQNIITNELQNEGFTINELVSDYKARMKLRINQWKKWSKNYKYKGDI